MWSHYHGDSQSANYFVYARALCKLSLSLTTLIEWGAEINGFAVEWSLLVLFIFVMKSGLK